MPSKLLSVVAGLSMFAVAGVASAGEPTKLTAAQMEGITAAGTGFVDVVVFFSKFKNVDTFINLNKRARVDARVDVDGFLADAEAFANCNGFGCTAETLTFADSDPFGVNNRGIPTATSASQSFAASSDPFKFKRGRVTP